VPLSAHTLVPLSLEQTPSSWPQGVHGHTMQGETVPLEITMGLVSHPGTLDLKA